MKKLINILFYCSIVFIAFASIPELTYEASLEDIKIIKLNHALKNFHIKMEKYIEFPEEEKDKDFTILFAGDILLANEAKEHIKKNGRKYPFSDIKDELEKHDIVFANIETPISSRGKAVKNKVYTFQVSEYIASSLNKIKLDMVSIANNHLMDYGLKGFYDTIKFLKANNIRYSGGGENLLRARAPSYMTINDTDVIFLSRCSRPPQSFYSKENKPGTAILNTEELIEDINLYKTDENIVIISLHWGIEQTHIPQSYQVEIAHKLIDAGADAIIGHHPHWPQSVEVYKHKPIFYSLGNFVNGYYNHIEKDNIVAIFNYEKNVLKKVEILSIAGKNKETAFQPFVIKGPRARANHQHLINISKKFHTPLKIEGYKSVIDFQTITE